MRSFTVEDFMKANIGVEYTQDVVQDLFGNREKLTALEISMLNVIPEDKIWFLTHVCMNAKVKRLFACACAERSLNREIENGNEIYTASLKGVEVARQFAEGSLSASSKKFKVARLEVENVERLGKYLKKSESSSELDPLSNTAKSSAQSVVYCFTPNPTEAVEYASVWDAIWYDEHTAAVEWQIQKAVELINNL